MPLRDGVPPDEGRGECADLLLVPHSYVLRPSQWPGLRRRFGPGTELTVGTDEARTARDAAAWRRRREHAENLDDLRHLVHARTYFLIGSRDVVAEAAMAFADAAGRGPRQRGVAEGRAVLITDVPGLRHRDPLGSSQIGIRFKPCPPSAHFKRPGR